MDFRFALKILIQRHSLANTVVRLKIEYLFWPQLLHKTHIANNIEYNP